MGERILPVEDDANFRGTFTLTLREALAPERLDVVLIEAGSLIDSRSTLVMPPGRRQFFFPRRDRLIGGAERTQVRRVSPAQQRVVYPAGAMGLHIAPSTTPAPQKACKALPQPH